MTTKELFTDVLKYIRHHQDGEVVAKMSEAGFRYNMNYGLSLYLLMKKAELIGRNHELAQLLWKEDIRETKLLYFMIEDPSFSDELSMERIVNSFSNHEMVEIACLHYFVYSNYALKKAKEWAASEKEYVKLTGFTLLGRVAMKRKDITLDDFRPVLSIFDTLPQTGSLFVKRCVSFAMSALAKAGLKKEIAGKAEQLQAFDSEVAQFVSQNVIEELKYI